MSIEMALAGGKVVLGTTILGSLGIALAQLPAGAGIPGATTSEMELVKVALNAGTTGVFGLYLYFSNKAREAADAKRDERYERLVDRTEKWQASADSTIKDFTKELVGTLRDIQDGIREISEKDRALVREVVSAVVEVKRSVDSQEGAIRELSQSFKSMQSELNSLRLMVPPGKAPGGRETRGRPNE